TPEITGAVVSTTCTVWLAVLVLPQASFAVHVRVTLYAWAQLPGVVTSANVRLGLGSHASDAVGVLNVGVAGHWIVLSGSTPEITGAVVSTTCTVWLAVLVLPQASFAVHVRVTSFACGEFPGVVTSANVSVGLGSHASVAVGELNVGVAGHWIVCAGPTPEITGAVVSTMWTVWLAVELLPHASFAVQVRVTSDFPVHVPGVVTSANVRVGLGSHASVAVGVLNVGVAGHWI